MLRESKQPSLKEQCAWCLGSIAGDSIEGRDAVLDSGVLQDFIDLVQEGKSTLAMQKTIAWAICKLCRAARPRPPLEKVRSVFPILAQLIHR
jgi:hypothetical protein